MNIAKLLTPIVAFVSTAGLTLQADAATELRFGHSQPPQSVTDQAAQLFKKRVEERTKGAYVINIYPSSQLGNSAKMVEGVRMGTVDLTANGNPFHTGFAPVMNVLDLPFLFRDLAHAHTVLDSAIGRDLLDSLEPHRIKGLAFWEIGFRHITNSIRPVRVPADLSGLKIRTTPNKAHLKAFQLMGANPVPMSFGEVYMALQTKTVDGQENPVWITYANRFNEVQKYMSMTGHAYTAQIFTMNLAKFNALPDDVQKLFLDAAHESAVFQREGTAKEEANQLAEMKKGGLEVIEKIDPKPFFDAVYEACKEDYVKVHGSRLVDAILNM